MFKKLYTIPVLILVIFALSVCAYADEGDMIDESQDSSFQSAEDILNDDSLSASLDTSDINQRLDNIITILETPSTAELQVEPTNNTTLQVLRVSSSDTSGLHSILLSLIGDYNPIVKDYTYTSSQGYTSHSIDISPDWSWILSAVVFVVILYSCFRILGMALGR